MYAMRFSPSIKERLAALALLLALPSCGEVGVAAGSWAGATSQVEYVREGTSGAERIDDSTDCGMDYVLGTLTYEESELIGIDHCMRARGYLLQVPGPGGPAPVWSLDSERPILRVG